MISTRGRYALRVIIDLAEHSGDGYIPMKDIALRQNISLKYLERILPLITKGGIIEGVHGKGGGYKLSAQPQDITVYDILSLTEGDIAPVACLEPGSAACPRCAECRTLPMWTEFGKITRKYFSSVTIADLMKN